MSNSIVTRLLNVPWSETDNEWSGSHCWGIVRLYFKDCLDIDLPKYAISPKQQKLVDSTVRLQRQDWDLVGRRRNRGESMNWECPVEQFDVALFSVPGWPDLTLSHCGVFINPRKILTTRRATGPYLIDLMKAERGRLIEVRRYNG